MNARHTDGTFATNNMGFEICTCVIQRNGLVFGYFNCSLMHCTVHWRKSVGLSLHASHICPHVFFSSASFAFESLFNQNFHNNFFPLLQQGTYSMYVDRGRGCGVAATIHLALLYSLGRGKPSNSKTASMNIQRAGCGGDISVVSVK